MRTDWLPPHNSDTYCRPTLRDLKHCKMRADCLPRIIQTPTADPLAEASSTAKCRQIAFFFRLHRPSVPELLPRTANYYISHLREEGTEMEFPTSPYLVLLDSHASSNLAEGLPLLTRVSVQPANRLYTVLVGFLFLICSALCSRSQADYGRQASFHPGFLGDA